MAAQASSLGRARLSCAPCRARKSKCDEQVPCSSCVMRGCSGACHLPAATTSKSKKAERALVSQMNKRARTSDLSETKPGPSQIRRIESESETPTLNLLSLHDRLTCLEKQLSMHLEGEASAAASSQCYIGGERRALDQAHGSPSSARLEDKDLEALLAVLPSQRDCEMILEYLLQEADWLVTYLDAPWIESIWSRFVSGANVTLVESVVIVSGVALGACFLNEGHHNFYSPTMPLETFPSSLIECVHTYLTGQETVLTRLPTASNSDILNELLILALLNDCFPFQGHRDSDCWPAARQAIHHWQQATDFLQEANTFWQRFDDIERERLRRLSWHFVNSERWLSIYGQYTPNNPFCSEEIQMSRPRYNPHTTTTLTAPFGSQAESKRRQQSRTAPSDPTITFRSPVRTGRARLFRCKEEHEGEEAWSSSLRFIDLSSHCLEVSRYVSALAEWRRDRVGRGAKGITDSDWNRRRETLLHHASTLSRQMYRWKSEVSREGCTEIVNLDASDYSQCRRASQAAVIHVGIRQLLNIVLGAWVTEYPSRRGVDSPPLLHKLQDEAFDNARGAVRSVETVRTLVCSGIAVQTPWTAMSMFDAAKMLAVPLLSASRGRRSRGGHDNHDDAAAAAAEEDSVTTTTDDYPRIIRMDPPLELSTIELSAAESVQLSQSINNMGASEGGVECDVTEAARQTCDKVPHNGRNAMRELASDLLCLLELLSLFTTSFLGSDARVRLATLIDTFSAVQGGRRQTRDDAARCTNQAADPAIRPPTDRGLDDNNAASLLNADYSVDGESSTTVLESLMKLDDAWWNELLSWNEPRLSRAVHGLGGDTPR